MWEESWTFFLVRSVSHAGVMSRVALPRIVVEQQEAEVVAGEG